MKCFFGHKFGVIQPDGYQYCATCGKAQKPAEAQKPHPCAQGHVWQTLQEWGYSGGDGFGSTWRDYKVSQVCTGCSEHRSFWKYGH